MRNGQPRLCQLVVHRAMPNSGRSASMARTSSRRIGVIVLGSPAARAIRFMKPRGSVRNGR
jgi:hypothetical protein